MKSVQQILGHSLLIAALAACSGGSGDPIYPDAGPDADPLLCSPLPTDSDGDTINDTHEGKGIGRDTDNDGTPDYLDADSDNDSVPDSVEAGDGDVCTEPRDTDGDGLPDFRETDADNNGVPDSDELGDFDGDGIADFADRDDDNDNLYDTEEWGGATQPVDTDADGSPDYHDTDSDADGVEDRYEGLNDSLDGDGLPAYRDLDSDGDGILDSVEGPAGTSPPADYDDDGAFDFLDVDSDNDGLGDAQEDLNGNGVLDPGESSAHDDDTDDDGFPDVVEWAAGSDPQDPLSGVPVGDFYFVLPLFDPEQEAPLDFSTDIIKADVTFECDTTGSMGGTIMNLQNSLQTVIVPQVALEVPNVAFGVGDFKDFPVGSFGGSSDFPFKLWARVTTDIDDVQAGLDQYVASGGADGFESGAEALYQMTTGEGIEWTVATAGEVPKFDPTVGYDPAKGHGVIGGAGFRIGALPIIVHATDIEYHPASDYWAAGITEAHTDTQAVNASIAMGARFLGITSSTTARVQLEQISRDTDAVVPPTAWGPSETFCHTGTGGAPRPPDPTGLCPLTFDMDWSGTGVDVQVVDGIKALVTYGTIDISAIQVADPNELPAIDTSNFIVGIQPLPPAPPGSSIDGDVFRDVLPGTPVTFTVHAKNNIVESRTEAQLFRVTIRVMGDGVTVLDERDVYVIVPGGGQDP
jgi:hypothetical protein